MQLVLWADATDLSSLNDMNLDRTRMVESQRNIVDDDTDAVWNCLANPSRISRRVDFVLDDAGFELFTDIVFAAYLLQSRLADSIVFHVKEFPWFVSGATPDDVESMFSYLESREIFLNRQHIDPLVQRLRAFIDNGQISIVAHSFWTTAHTFHDIEHVAPNLFKSLRSSGLVIFKGDLNYRKLTRDGLWPHSTPFAHALGPLGLGSQLKILALRRNISDVCVGVNSRFLNALNEESSNGEWLQNGTHAVVSFSDGARIQHDV